MDIVYKYKCSKCELVDNDNTLDCSIRFTCCSCGDNQCGCRYCYDCNACDTCKDNRE